MLAVLDPICEEAPSVPERRTRQSGVTTGEPGRVAAFLFDLDALFDDDALQTAKARATARAVADRRELDPMWLEVMAVEMSRQEGGTRANDVLQALVGEGENFEIPATVYDELKLEPGVEEILGGIHRRFKLAVVSNHSRIETMRILRALGLADRFDAGAFADGCSGSTCERAMQLLEEKADSCVVVGRLGSKALRHAGLAGMRAVGLTTGAGTTAALEAAGADLVVANLELVGALADGASSIYDDPAEVG